MRIKPPPTGRSRTRHLVIVVLGSALAASGFSKLLLGELLGAEHTAQVIAWFASFTLFLVVDLTDALDDER
jgi:hypothetical protein